MVDLELPTKLQDTVTIFMAIMLEATPFVVLGVLVVILINTFVSQERLLKLIPDNVLGSHFVSSILGMLFPVCECGNIPVMRQLIAKGVKPSQAISFFLGAPIANIVVITTTVLAFSDIPLMIWSRLVGGIFIATITGVLISILSKDKDILTPQMNIYCERSDLSESDHNHADHENPPENQSKLEKIVLKIFSKNNLVTFRTEFLNMFGLLRIGAFFAAITRIWMTADILEFLASNPVWGILTLMLLAVIMSICSTVDAFVARGFVSQFSPSAIYAFLVFGPMIDLKAISMLATTIKPWWIFRLTLIVSLLTISTSLIFVLFGY